jgi:hypothetical protein
VGVDDHLAERVFRPNRALDIAGNVLKQTQHRGNPPWVNTILRLFQTDEAGCMWVCFEDGQGQEPQGSIREGARWVDSAIVVGDLQYQEFTLFVPVDVDGVDVIDEFGQASRDLIINPGSHVFLRCVIRLRVRMRKAKQSGSEMGTIGAQGYILARYDGEWIRFSQGRRFQLE